MDEALLGYVEKIDQLNERLRAEIDRLTAEKSGWSDEFERLLNRAVKAEQEIERLTAPLERYGHHLKSCVSDAPGECSCGFLAMRRAALGQSVSGERK